MNKNKIINVMKNYYGMDIQTVLPEIGGWAALAYKIFDDEQAYFLKVYEKRRASTAKWTSLIDTYVPIMIWLAQNSDLSGKYLNHL